MEEIEPPNLGVVKMDKQNKKNLLNILQNESPEILNIPVGTLTKNGLRKKRMNMYRDEIVDLIKETNYKINKLMIHENYWVGRENTEGDILVIELKKKNYGDI